MITIKQFEVRIVQFESKEEMEKSLIVLKNEGWKFDKWYGKVEQPYLKIEREVEISGECLSWERFDVMV